MRFFRAQQRLAFPAAVPEPGHWRAWAVVGALCVPLSAGAQTSFQWINGQAFAVKACGSEYQTCKLTQTTTVAFGSQGRFAVKSFGAGTLPCNASKFGDPNIGQKKACYLALPKTTPISLSAPELMRTARLLNQATWGATLDDITLMGSKTPSVWIDEQLAKPMTLPTHWNYVAKGGPTGKSVYVNATMESFWSQAVTGPDQLRQRMAFALSEVFVISTVNSPLEIFADALASYLDMLARNAFGNYRTLLEDVARHPTMGKYLSHLGNRAEDPISGRIPDENFAREVMQLFSIGLWELNPDGSRRLDASGEPIPTYGQDEVMGMAKVFTGWSWGNGDYASGTMKPVSAKNKYQKVWNLPMQSYPEYTSTSEKRIVRGVVIPAGTNGPQSLKIALDTLANHPNVGPFLGRQLIQRFVTSNPTPAYVARVSAVWANNGKGVRGDLGAVIKAILLDPEARSDASLGDPQFGKIREPALRFGQWLRAFDVKASDNTWSIWNLQDVVKSLGQNPLRAPSVFNWFRPDYSPPGAMQAGGLVAPELQITHETTLTGYTNFINSAVANGLPDIKIDYTRYTMMADRPSVLLDALSLPLTSGQLTPATRLAIQSAIEATPMTVWNARNIRTKAAIYLIMSSPEYTVQR